MKCYCVLLRMRKMQSGFTVSYVANVANFLCCCLHSACCHPKSKHIKKTLTHWNTYYQRGLIEKNSSRNTTSNTSLFEILIAMSEGFLKGLLHACHHQSHADGRHCVLVPSVCLTKTTSRLSQILNTVQT